MARKSLDSTWIFPHEVAVVAHPPVLRTLKSIIDNDARSIEGVRDVFEIPLVKGSGVAVVAINSGPQSRRATG